MFNERAASDQLSIVSLPSAAACGPCQENFEPQTIRVLVGVNNTVRWVNNDHFPAMLEADNNSDPLFYTVTKDFIVVSHGDSFEFTFTKPGEYGYHGKPWQRGTVIVLPPDSNKNAICGDNIESVRENAPFALLLPQKLPAGYSLQSVVYVPDVYVNMQYFTRSLCDPNNPYEPEQGVIEIVEASFSKESDAKNGTEYVHREMARFQASNINATSYVLQDGRMHGVGYWDQDYLKARLVVVDDKTGTLVVINARSLDTPLETLAMIADSLME